MSVNINKSNTSGELVSAREQFNVLRNYCRAKIAEKELYMDKVTLGLIAGLGTIVAASSAQASTSAEPEAVLRANSVAELLTPIPNALEKLRALDAQAEVKPEGMQVAEKIIIKHDHHHPHPHPYRRPHHHHHHHHHMM